VGLVLGHTGRGGFAIAGLANAVRAVPAFGLMILLYVVVSPKSAPLPVAAGASGPLAHGPVTITIVVHVPGNTPATDDVYLSTDRSSYNPSEVPMQRVDGTTFSVAVTVASGTTLKYEFTRGTYATVERDRTGGIVTPRPLNVDTAVKTEDTVARWADLS